MSGNFYKMRAAYAAAAVELEDAMFEGLDDCRLIVEDHARATTSYENDSFATRASTMAAIERADGQRDDSIQDSRQEAEDHRPGSVRDEPPPPPQEGTMHIICFSSTFYSYYLNIRDGGSSMWTADAILANTGQIAQSVQDHINQVRVTDGSRP